MALPTRSRRRLRPSAPLPIVILASAGAAFFIIPLLGLLLRTPWTSAWQQLGSAEVQAALRLSLLASFSATAIALILGVPLAWTFARLTFPGRSLLRALMAETFVAMPFLVITVEAGLRSMDTRFEDAARTLGASRWTVLWRVTLPLVRPSLIAGAVLCWARALGEFGATITFAGNFPGRTQTMPLAVYLALESNPDAAIVLSLVLLAISLAVLIGLRDRWLGAS
jgi:molybdate transport system permease protein